MPCTRVVWGAVPAACVLLLPGLALAGQAAAPPGLPADRGLFTKNALGVDATASVAVEAWSLNDSREWLTAGSFSVWWAFREGAALAVEFHATRIAQDRPRAAFVTAVSPAARFRLIQWERSSLFVDLGGGVSWSDTTVPARGTRFNFVIVTSLGATRRLTRQTHLVGGFRITHFSNGGRDGRNRNPDIEAIGGYLGVSVVF